MRRKNLSYLILIKRDFHWYFTEDMNGLIYTMKDSNQSLKIWSGTQFSRPTPELGPLQAHF